MSTNLAILIAGILYIFIGVMVAAIIDGGNELDSFFFILAFWPLCIFGVLLIVVMAIPFNIGLWIREKFIGKF